MIFANRYIFGVALLPCPGCRRHVFAHERACPFCRVGLAAVLLLAGCGSPTTKNVEMVPSPAATTATATTEDASAVEPATVADAGPPEAGVWRNAVPIYGAPLTRVTANLHFALGSDALQPETQKTLDEVAAFMSSTPSVLVLAEGHGSSNEPNVDKLATSRAHKIVDALIKRGVAKDRLRYRGNGKNKPIMPGPDAKNRRVELDVKEASEFPSLGQSP